jgi:hypothetical protein
MRLRRTVIGLLTLLLCGTGAARWAEDPADVVATGVNRDLRQRATGAEARPLPPEGGPGAQSATPGRTPPSGRATATGATPHADEDSDPEPPTPPVNPAQPAVPAAGTGAITAVTLVDGPAKTSGRTVRYSVEVEDGLPVNPAEVAQTVQSVLVDGRGWQTKDDVRLVPVGPAELASGAGVDIRVTLASPALTAKLCAPLNVSAQQVSCWNGGRSVLNLTRWVRGSATYGSDLGAYRVYLINHEVGHGLGHQHVGCPGAGQHAPVMVQQTKSLEGCTPWPYPTGP